MGEAEGGMIWENGIETCINESPVQVRCMILDAWGLVHWDDPEGWYGEGGGKVVQDGEHRYTHDGFESMYGKTNTIL